MYNGNMARTENQNTVEMCPHCECGVDHHLYSCSTLVPKKPETIPMTINSFTGFYRFLSNFWPAEVWLEGVSYPSVENAYQAAKTTSLALREPFRTYSAAEAKKHSHRLVVRPDWEQIKLGVMQALLEQKFLKGSELRAKLEKTRGKLLVEGNWWHDNFWGDCSCITRANCVTPGMNHLGRLLMEIRDRTD